METLTGRTQSELIGSDFADLFSEPLRAVVSLKRTLICLSLLDHELALLPRDGQQTMVALNSSTFYDRDRSLQGVIFSVRDVTVRHFLNRALQETNASLAGARLTAVQDRRAAIDRLRATNQVMLQQLQSVLNVIARLEAEPPSPDPAHTAKLAQALQHSRVLLESVQSTIAPQAAN